MRTDVFSASQSSYDCYRKIFFEMTYPRTANEDSLGRFAMGDVVHDIIQGAFVEAKHDIELGQLKNYSVEGVYDFSIKGHCDIKWNDTVIEVKSVSPFAWKYVVSGGTDRFGRIIVPKPKVTHIRQLNTYMDVFRLKKGIILYVNKDDLSNFSYPFNFDEYQLAQTVGRCVSVYNAIIDKRVPDKQKSDECTQCNHRDLCKKA